MNYRVDTVSDGSVNSFRSHLLKLHQPCIGRSLFSDTVLDSDRSKRKSPQ